MVHGDDYTSLGNLNSLKWLRAELKKRFECKSTILGPDGEPDCEGKVRILNRELVWRNWGIEYRPDARHAREIVRAMGMSSANPVTTPDERDDEEREGESAIIDESRITKYRSTVARANYMCIDRADIQHAVQGLCQHMQYPSEHQWRKLKRMARYLKGKEQVIVKFPWRLPCSTVIALTDSNWAGDRKTRKSVSGGVLTIGGHVVKTWSKGQSLTALSSAEAEFYAAIKATSELLGLMSILAEWGQPMGGVVRADASAALGIISRKGLGKVRHLDTNHLWIQEVSAKRSVEFSKIAGEANSADLMTKAMDQRTLLKHLKALMVEIEETDAKEEPEEEEGKEPEYSSNINSSVRVRSVNALFRISHEGPEGKFENVKVEEFGIEEVKNDEKPINKNDDKDREKPQNNDDKHEDEKERPRAPCPAQVDKDLKVNMCHDMRHENARIQAHQEHCQHHAQVDHPGVTHVHVQQEEVVHVPVIPIRKKY